MLKTLSEMIGVSGYENKLTEYLYHELCTIDHGKAYIDKVGNLVFYVKGSNSQKKVLIQSHIDEVGFQVISEVEKGRYSLKSLGNIKTWNAHQQRVVSDKGINGVIYAKDPEQLKSYNYDNLFLSIETKDASETVSLGDVFTFESSFLEMDECFVGKALDNRVSCYCLVNAISKCKTLKNDTYFCFSVMEEINMRGARVLKSTLQPDVSITVDVSGIGDRNSLKQGMGVGIKVSDGMGVSTQQCVERAVMIAKENGIKYQMEVSNGGTSELVISNEIDNGCEEIGISIPCDYMHTANTKVYKRDVSVCMQFLPILLENI